MKKEELKKEIERVWGPYSPQAICFRSITQELRESQKNLKSPNLYDLEPKKEINFEEKREKPLVSTSDVVNATLSFYLTRGFFIVGTWAIFTVILLAVGFASWTFLF